MTQQLQFSLFGAASGRGLLFESGILRQYLDELAEFPIPGEAERVRFIQEWLDALKRAEATELSLEPAFLQRIMTGVLGYTLYPSATGPSTLYSKPGSALTRISRTPDAILGLFTAEESQFTVAVELKEPGTPLDVPQARERPETPVEQGFYYGRRILGVRWVLVSDMRIIRLYSVGSMHEYEEVDLAACCDDEGRPTHAFRKLYFLLHHDQLVAGHDASPVAALHSKTSSEQLRIRDSFYEVYYQVRSDVYDAIRVASSQLASTPSHPELLEATQRLLDRMLFIYYCEDHPQQLIPQGTVATVTEAARKMPGPRQSKVFDALKALFREVDEGSPPSSLVKIAGYNGELFKDHWILDHVDLPDSLHDRRYQVPGMRRVVQGTWGLHVFDFWRELNEHLLGHIFEASLSDLEQLGQPEAPSAAERLRERKRNGVFYTSSLLSDFLSESALEAVLNERAPLVATDPKSLVATIEIRLDALRSLKVLDPACGSGAFLVSAFRGLLDEYWRLRALHHSLRGARAASLFDDLGAQDQAALLRGALFGVDLLPQAVEIAKLALWLRSARKGERVANLGNNVVSGNSLDVATLFARLGEQPGAFDLVIGNPPWGGEIDTATYASAMQALEIPDLGWDSWELFVLLALRALREGGRLAFVLPDSLLYEDKARIRRLVLQYGQPEKVHNLGPDWFGKTVRMGTTVLQVRRGPVSPDADMICALLSGPLRVQAIQGTVPLTQIEAQRARKVPLARTLASPHAAIEVFRGKRDDRIIETMEAHSANLQSLCERGRGEEMNKAGRAWECPSCLFPTTPGEKEKGGGYKSKPCPSCGLLLHAGSVNEFRLVTDERSPSRRYDAYTDGDDITRRFQQLKPSRWLDVGLSGWSYKDAALYRGPKILVRQAGVGIVAALDTTDARCPQSVYIYRLVASAQQHGYTHEYVLGTLLSRTMAYFVFKCFGEVDPAKAHAKLTHQRLSTLPIPRVDFADRAQRTSHDVIRDNVRSLVEGTAALGGAEDRRIEQELRSLWGLAPLDGAHINREFLDVPDSQAVRDLFPNGVPRAAVVPPMAADASAP